MRERQPVTFLLTGSSNPFIDWTEIATEHCLIRISNAPLFFAAFEHEARKGAREITTVIFDQSIRSEVYLEFLANLPSEFRGDVLLIRKRGRSFLSSSSRADGRFLYDMTARDVRFYISTILPGQPAVPHEDSLQEVTPMGEALEQTIEAGWPETSIPARASIRLGNESTGILPFAAATAKDRHKPKRVMQLR